MTTHDAWVTAIIPTIGRDSLERSVRSAVRQTLPTNCIVVVDRQAELEGVRNRMRSYGTSVVVVPGDGLGPSAARNKGLNLVTAPYAAYLDDDDYWEPEKSQLQVAMLNEAGSTHAVSTTATHFYRSNGHIEVLPRTRLLREMEVVDYLVSRPSLRFGDGFLQSSSLLGPTDVLRNYRWDDTFSRHEDWELFMRIARDGVCILQHDRPLTHVFQASSESLSRSFDWDQSDNWLKSHGAHMRAKTRSDFIATQLLRGALAQRSFELTLKSIRRMRWVPPHGAAIVVGVSGLLSSASRRKR